MKKESHCLVSVDLDFFCREELEWDWGHNEENPIFFDVAWQIRYSSIDLYAETDPAVYADCLPVEFLHILMDKGLTLTKQTRVGVGWSHRFAYGFFKDEPARILFNFDAHHDAWPMDAADEEPICSNWLTALHKDEKLDQSFWVYPKWLDIEGYRKPTVPISEIKFQDLNLDTPMLIDAIFFAQSPAWVPPHFDEWLFSVSGGGMAMQAAVVCGRVKRKRIVIDYDRGILNRKVISPAEARESYQEHQQSLAEYRQSIEAVVKKTKGRK